MSELVCFVSSSEQRCSWKSSVCLTVPMCPKQSRDFNQIHSTLCIFMHLPESCNSNIDEAVKEINYFLPHIAQILVQIVQAKEFAIAYLR